MKKILIMTMDLRMGGIEKSLISMLKEIDKSSYDITLLVVNKNGDLQNEIPNNIKVIEIYGEKNGIICKFKKYMHEKKYIKAVRFLYNGIGYKLANKYYNKDGYYINMSECSQEKYDIAIAYHGQMSLPLRYIIKKVNSKKKVMWIHSDPSVYKHYMKKYEKYYKNIDTIFCVSNYCKNEFLKLYPYLENKTHVFYNIIKSSEILKLSNEETESIMNIEDTNILTVGRIDKEKGQQIIPYIMLRLLKYDANIKWYIIGDGGERDNLEKKIKQLNLERNIVILGQKQNPYPYMKKCDIYVQPSIHESYGMTIAEAKILNKPVISTNTIGANEQISNNINGIILNYDINEISNKIIELIEKTEIINYIKNNLEKEYLDTTNQISKLYNLIKA